MTLSAFGEVDFWLGVGVLAGIYGIFTLGLQLNLGVTGVYNFAQAGFMAIGAYAMAILVAKAGWSFWLALPAATLITVVAGMLIGLTALRLRADYFAIATIAFAEIVRYVAQNARGLTGGAQGLLGYDATWADLSTRMQDSLGLGTHVLAPLLMVTWGLLLVLIVVLRALQRSPWGRVLRAVREDEDAARALGKNAFARKLQSLAIAAALGALAGYLLALDLTFLAPEEFDSSFTFIGFTLLILGGLASFPGVALGSILLWTVLEGTRFLGLPISDDKVAALRFMIVGLALILLVAFRPQGILGKREEMVLGD